MNDEAKKAEENLSNFIEDLGRIAKSAEIALSHPIKLKEGFIPSDYTPLSFSDFPDIGFAEPSFDISPILEVLNTISDTLIRIEDFMKKN